MECYVLALGVLALILAATPIQTAPLGHAYRVRRFGRSARAAEARSPEWKA